jgi:hypothetical protein
MHSVSVTVTDSASARHAADRTAARATTSSAAGRHLAIANLLIPPPSAWYQGSSLSDGGERSGEELRSCTAVLEEEEARPRRDGVGGSRERDGDGGDACFCNKGLG